jgi:NADPH2:quinone reductase
VPYFTAYRALVTKGHLKKGQTVLIHGASGGVGVGALQIAKDLGATVIGTASSPEGLKLIGQYGTAFNHRQNGYEKEIAAKFPHINLIIEVLANVNIGKDLELIGHGGTIVIIGCRGLGQNVPLANTMMKEVEIRGLTLYAATDADCQETGTYITAGLQKGVLVPIVAEKFSFDKAADAHEKVMGEVKAPGKLVLIP